MAGGLFHDAGQSPAFTHAGGAYHRAMAAKQALGSQTDLGAVRQRHQIEYDRLEIVSGFADLVAFEQPA